MRPAGAALLVAAAVALCGCGLGPGAAPGGVGLTVTRDFGSTVVHQSSAPHVVGDETVMQLLMRNAQVGTAYGGGFVQSVNGLSSQHGSGRPVDWFYYVNGIQADRGAADTRLHEGDHVWWDLHDWTVTEDIPAVVGAFPEPFLNGDAGKRLPVRIDCTDASSPPCHAVQGALRAAGVPAAVGTLGTDEPQTLVVLVGPWSAIHADPAALALQRGPRDSGVYARPAADGRTIALLDAGGATARVLGAGAGLVAATRYSSNEPTWMVTGTDAAGVAAAARSLSASTLHDRFALAIDQGRDVALPVGAR